MIKSGKTDIADVCTASNPSPFSVSICKSKTAGFPTTVTTVCDILNEEVNPPQLDDIEGSKQTMYTDSED